jgi:UDP-N-acetyl-D-galactosamine dehydrogenase
MVDIVKGFTVLVRVSTFYDPLADPEEVNHEYDLPLTKVLNKKYHSIILAVSHQDFDRIDWESISYDNTVIYDEGTEEQITARLNNPYR